MIKGWAESSQVTIDQVLKDYESTEINGFILTDIDRDGMLEGLNVDLIKENILKTNKNIIVGGGLSNYDDLINLKKFSSSNLEGVIAGKSFYSGNIEITKATTSKTLSTPSLFISPVSNEIEESVFEVC